MTRARDVATQGGLVLINKTDFTNTASVSLNNIFTSTYINYRVLIESTSASATGSVRLRYRLNGTDATASFYDYMNLGIDNIGGSQSVGTYSQSSFIVGALYAASNQFYKATIDIFGPNDSTQRKSAIGNIIGSTSGGGVYSGTLGLFYFPVSQFDGITVFPNSGTFTGTIRVYGYRN